MISFVITTHNEGACIESLLNQLSTIVKDGDEIIILDDFSTDQTTLDILEKWTDVKFVSVHKRNLDNDFAAQKNFAIEKATQPWIFQIDADELLGDYISEYIHSVLESNPDIDLFLVPRVNLVTGLTDEDIQKFNWHVNDYGWVMWPDFQHRIFKNKPELRWKGSVHETMTGVLNWTTLPTTCGDDEDDPETGWALLHFKDIDRQRAQNEFYSTISRQS